MTGRLIVVLLAATALLIVAGAALLIASLPLPNRLMDWGFPGFQAVAGAVFAIVGALIAARRPQNLIGWLLVGAGLLGAIQFFAHYYAVFGLVAAPGSVPLPVLGLWIEEWIWIPTAGTIGIFTLLLFPNGRLPSRRWRPVVWAGGVGIALAMAGFALTPELGGTSILAVSNPIGAPGDGPMVGIAIGGGMLLILTAMLASSVSLVLRLRAAVGVERQQLKWLALAGVVAAGGFVVYVGPAIVSGEEPLPAIGLALAFLGFPFAIGIAILRHRLLDIDLVIKRTLIYGLLSLALGAIYVVSILVLQGLLAPLTDQSALAVAASTLAVAALFRPMRDRIQEAVNRRFYRERYHAQRTLDAFAGRLREEVHLEHLTGELVGVARSTVQPTSASIWLRQPKP